MRTEQSKTFALRRHGDTEGKDKFVPSGPPEPSGSIKSGLSTFSTPLPIRKARTRNQGANSAGPVNASGLFRGLAFPIVKEVRNIDNPLLMNLQPTTGPEGTHLSFPSVSPCLRGAKVLLLIAALPRCDNRRQMLFCVAAS